jgi:hypothetical protein
VALCGRKPGYDDNETSNESRPYRKNPKARSATARTATAGSGREFEAASEKLMKTTSYFNQLELVRSSPQRREGRLIYQIIRRLPASEGAFQYAIRSAYEDHQPVAKEYGLSRN